jgi:hypothetical protein
MTRPSESESERERWEEDEREGWSSAVESAVFIDV